MSTIKKPTLLASSPTRDGIITAISRYYMGSTISLQAQGNVYQVSNLKGPINSVRVIQKGKRWRFEQIN